MFSPDNMMNFHLFSVSHLLTILLFFLLAGVMVMVMMKGRDNKGIGTLLVGILAVSEISYQVWSVLYGNWSFQTTMPLHLCSISTFIGIYLYFKKNVKWFYLFLYIGFIPPILAIITPDNPYAFPHYRYLKYFLHHMGIPLMVLYLFFHDRYQVPKRSIFYGLFLVNCLAVPILIINKLSGSNYFFLSGPPEGNTPLLWFGDGFVYFLNLELAAVVVFTLNYFLFRWLEKYRKQERQRVQEEG
ncbi:TIGR02206 family membrane protein [Rossellomorea aquimaris]|uniref:YwaF family protein n=1 Tax=Rossellomorea aquimaris TaxID=189382 RepID=UPI001CD7C8D2|nr:TIGR02206 family membrane protein [Rossellomorea aquimaris]MCA1054476.1 TIGR02206 family membrane protein [Rossellomorea aquimaris]